MYLRTYNIDAYIVMCDYILHTYLYDTDHQNAILCVLDLSLQPMISPLPRYCPTTEPTEQ